MFTTIVKYPLCLSASFKYMCPYARTHASAAIQSLSDKEVTDAPSGSGVGRHTHCVCVLWVVLVQTTFNNHKLSTVQV